jgi:hypothetical protein
VKRIRPKNWNEFQHYKDRSPGWIKLYKTLLDDIEFNQLDAFACKVLVLFWLIASEHEDGWIVYNPNKIAFRMRLSTVDVAEALEVILTAGFIVVEGVDHEEVEDRLATAQKAREAVGWGSRYINDQVKREVWSRDGGACVHCSATEDIEYDHIIPISKGGSSEARNVQLLCRPCNRKKRVSVPAEQVATSAQPPPETLEPRETSNKSEGQVQGEKKRAPAARRVVSPEPLPSWVPKEAWDAFVEMRQRIKAPLTDNAKHLTLKDLEKLRDDGHDPRTVLEESVKNSWRGLFPPKEKTDGKRGRSSRLDNVIKGADRFLGEPDGAEENAHAGTGKPARPGEMLTISAGREIGHQTADREPSPSPGSDLSGQGPDRATSRFEIPTFLRRVATTDGLGSRSSVQTVSRHSEGISASTGPNLGAVQIVKVGE